jgi:hypothetical protein
VNYTAFNLRRPVVSGPEKRRSPRQNVRCVGLIHDDQGSIIAQCIMMDVSASGAKLVMEAGFNVPDEFVLTLARNAGVRRNCEVVWRAAKSIGVCFVTRRAEAS